MERIGDYITEILEETTRWEEMVLTPPSPSIQHTTKASVTNLPARYENKGFKNFNVNGVEINYDFCLEYAKRFNEHDKSLVLMGNYGTGKTHLAIAVMRNLPPQNVKMAISKIADEVKYVDDIRQSRCLFLIADEFFQELNDSLTQKKSKLDVIRGYFDNFDLVCLDDLGVKNFTEAKRENLYLFVNRAYIENKKIIITTNFMLDDFDKIDGRISSRLLEMADLLAFTGKDYRRFK